MSERFATVLINAQHAHTVLRDLWAWLKPRTLAGHRYCVEVKQETRTTNQNRMLWSILFDLSAQVQWPVDGKAQKLAPEDWKHILSAGLQKHQRIAQGIDGGFVMLGQRTSKMTVAEMGELIELAYAFGAEHGIKWSRTSLGRDVPDEVLSAD